MTNKSKILIVDDEIGILEALSYFLKEEGYEVETAVNGKEAFAKILSLNFDGVVSDLMMPEMDGLTLIKNVRAENIVIPFLFLSGHADSDDEQQMINYGTYKLIHKPDLGQVPKALRSLLSIDNKILSMDEQGHGEVEFLELINNAGKAS